MKSIVFFDIEADPQRKTILDIGAVSSTGKIFHSKQLHDFIRFLEGSDYLCGHNVLNHDLKYIQKADPSFSCTAFGVIDTLFLSPLFFPARPYHRLLKDDLLHADDASNPVNDSRKAQELFFDEVGAFAAMDNNLKSIFTLLLHGQEQFSAFFQYCAATPNKQINLVELIKDTFAESICSWAPVDIICAKHPVELAYVLALIGASDRYSITPPWVMAQFQEVERIMYLLRNKPCLKGCGYCNKALDSKAGLRRWFGFNEFRSYGEKPLQEQAATAAINGKSLLAVFPTGGGKSITFQLPALMAGESAKGLTVVISPLQSLMKDQVDTLERIGITEAVTISGLLDPIERAKSVERVQNGQASLLYISPESLRSKTIERLLLKRNIVRIVIDEAHCLSAWGQDFRVDYLYIGPFIAKLQTQKDSHEAIPVSCFTATAKPEVIEDIRGYFSRELSLDLELYHTNATRTNLHYNVFDGSEEHKKYSALRNLLSTSQCPAIVYVSRTRRANELAKKLEEDGFVARPYHGKMDKEKKKRNQDAFLAGEVRIMVATSAFGMGVDKKDVGMVVHYEISDSLENYIQEAGRAGRDANLSADCYILFDEEDLNKHFMLLNQTKLSKKEIQQIWRALKYMCAKRTHCASSALEIARTAGWNENGNDLETRVKTAIAALEQAGYVRRGQNIPRIFANSIQVKTAKEAYGIIDASPHFSIQQKLHAKRIMSSLFSTKRIKQAEQEDGESRVDYISNNLGIVREEVIRIITLLRQEKILADNKDLIAFIGSGGNRLQSQKTAETFACLENFLLSRIEETERILPLKQLAAEITTDGDHIGQIKKIRTILNYWSIKNWIKKYHHPHSNDCVSAVLLRSSAVLQAQQEKRHELAGFILEHLFKKELNQTSPSQETDRPVVFSVLEIKSAYEEKAVLLKSEVSIDDVEDTLFYLSRIGAIVIEGGFLVTYNALTIERLETNNALQYKTEDYQQLHQFYSGKMQQIHIVGEYARKMMKDPQEARRFVDDYFKINYSSFVQKYFPGSRGDELKKNLTPQKFRQLFGDLSDRQLAIINDKDTKNIVVAAGPGSGKTRVLVHKLASLLLTEDIKHEQLLMLTFSRAAVTEFKKRLLGLIGNAANFVEIRTFHSFCFDILGRVGDITKTDTIIADATKSIRRDEVEFGRISKSVLVIDEAQDMDAAEYELIKALIEKNEEIRIIAVGDDDQNIFAFRGSDSRHFQELAAAENAKVYELIENYRSKRNLVDYTNRFALGIRQRFKTHPITPVQPENGQVKIISHKSPNMISPLVDDVCSGGLSGTTAIFVTTNEEAYHVLGSMIQRGMPAKLIQSTDGFSLCDVLEIRSFLQNLAAKTSGPLINEETWQEAVQQFKADYNDSSNINWCLALLADFHTVNPKKKYISDFNVYLHESRIEDFLQYNGETVQISTIHKAKGREFDNVFILLKNYNISTDDQKRVLYVAMTRAKQLLTIHYNNSFLDAIVVDGLSQSFDSHEYPEAKRVVVCLTHKDVHLGYFEFIQHRLKNIRCGQQLKLEDHALTSKNGKLVQFSQAFLQQKNALEAKGYRMTKAEVNMLVYWKMPEQADKERKELLILLPKIEFSVPD